MGEKVLLLELRLLAHIFAVYFVTHEMYCQVIMIYYEIKIIELCQKYKLR